MCPYIFNDGTVPRVDASKHAFAGAQEKSPFFPLPVLRCHSRRVSLIAIVDSTVKSVLIFWFSAQVAQPIDSCVHADGHTPGLPLGRAQYPELLPVGLSTHNEHNSAIRLCLCDNTVRFLCRGREPSASRQMDASTSGLLAYIRPASVCLRHRRSQAQGAQARGAQGAQARVAQAHRRRVRRHRVRRRTGGMSGAGRTGRTGTATGTATVTNTFWCSHQGDGQAMDP